MAIEDVLLDGKSALEDVSRESRRGRVMRESTADLLAPTALSTDPDPPAAGLEEVRTKSLEDELAEAATVPADSVSSAAQLDQVARITAGDENEAATTIEGVGTISAGQGEPVISAGSPTSDSVATTNKATGETISASTGTPPEGAPAASVEKVEGGSLEESLTRAEIEPAPSGGGGGGVGLSDILASPAVQKALTSFGQAAAGGDNEAVNAIAAQGRRLAESNARRKLRSNLEEGQSVEEALNDPEVAGISPEASQSIVNEFQSQELAEERVSADIEQGEERLDLQEQELELRRQIEEGELEIAEEREERLRQGQAFDQYIQRQQLALDKRAQQMEEELQSVTKELRESQINLNRARAEDIGSDEEGLEGVTKQINALNRVAGTAAQLEQQTAEQIRLAQDLQEGIISDLPEDSSSKPFSGVNVRSKTKTLVQKVAQDGSLDTGDKSMSEFLSDQGIPDAYKPDVRQAIRKQEAINNLKTRIEDIRRVGDQANEEVLSTFRETGNGSGGQNNGSGDSGEDNTGSDESEIVQVESEEEARQLPVGTRFKLPDGRTGTVN